MYKDTDYVYQVASVRALEPKLMDSAAFEKMINVPNSQSACNVLYEQGFSPKDNYLDSLEDSMCTTVEFLEKIGAGQILAVKRLENDYYNIKSLIKSEFAEDPHIDESTNGNFTFAQMREMFVNRQFGNFSDVMRSAVEEAFEVYTKTSNARDIDNALDKAFFEERADIVKKIPDELLREIYETEESVFRVEVRRRMGEDVDVQQDKKRLNELICKAKGFSFGLAPLYAYLLAKEQEIMKVRVIIACKNSGMAPEIIRKKIQKYL